MKSFDTVNLVVRVCQGDLPGQQRDLDVDYFPQICAYTKNNNKRVTYTVVGFDLFYKDSINQIIDSAFAEGNQFSTPKMQYMIIRAAKAKAVDKLFLSNIILMKDGERIIIRGPWTLVP